MMMKSEKIIKKKTLFDLYQILRSKIVRKLRPRVWRIYSLTLEVKRLREKDVSCT